MELEELVSSFHLGVHLLEGVLVGVIAPFLTFDLFHSQEAMKILKCFQYVPIQ